MGPFYCPGDQKVYLDMAFFQELSRRFGAPGDFAQAYVIAHEVGHHVQNLLGITDRVHSMQGRASEAEYNQLSVRLELQADFLAGVWAHHAERARQILETGDIEEALNAASAIGDDTIQKRTQGYVVPDAFTHGSSAQRARWFRLGRDGGPLQGRYFWDWCASPRNRGTPLKRSALLHEHQPERRSPLTGLDETEVRAARVRTRIPA